MAIHSQSLHKYLLPHQQEQEPEQELPRPPRCHPTASRTFFLQAMSRHRLPEQRDEIARQLENHECGPGRLLGHQGLERREPMVLAPLKGKRPSRMADGSFCRRYSQNCSRVRTNLPPLTAHEKTGAKGASRNVGLSILEVLQVQVARSRRGRQLGKQAAQLASSYLSFRWGNNRVNTQQGTTANGTLASRAASTMASVHSSGCIPGSRRGSGKKYEVVTSRDNEPGGARSSQGSEDAQQGRAYLGPG